MSNRDFYVEAASQRAAEIEAERAQALADLASAKRYGDTAAAASTVQTIANLAAEQRNLQQLHSDYVASQSPPAPRQLSLEEKIAKPWHEMTPDDALELAKTSKYGRDLSHDDPNVRAGYQAVLSRRGRQEG